MSAPNTNLQKQERRHAGPLIIMAACLGFVAIILVAYFGFIVDDVDDGAVGADVTAPVASE